MTITKQKIIKYLKKLILMMALILVGTSLGAYLRIRHDDLHQISKEMSLLECHKKNGLRANCIDKNGNSILSIMAARIKNPKVLILYLIEGLNINHQNFYDYTPLMLAIKYNKNPNIIKFLLDHGADVNKKNIYGDTALIMAIKYNRTLKEIKLILKQGADVNAKNKVGYTPLKYAMKYENYKIMDLLVKYGADVAMRTDHGVTVLHWGSLLVKPKIIVRLIEKYNADVNVVDDYGYTPLIYAMAR